MREKLCIVKEFRSVEYGDIVFPFKDFDASWSYDWSCYNHIEPFEARKKFFTEIRMILNNSIDNYGVDYREMYINAYERIKEYHSGEKYYTYSE
jgi:hypothetical protein